MAFPVITKEVHKSELLVFFDLEATQFSRQAIAIGLVAYKKDPDSLLPKEEVLRYFSYIKTDDEIGPIVEELTGIHRDNLDYQGISYHQMILEVSKLLRPYKFRKFISYGGLDIEILKRTMKEEDETEVNFFRNVIKNYFDFHSYLEHRIVTENGFSYSLTGMANSLSVSEEGTPHDPLFDSLLLKDIYTSFVSDEERALSLAMENYDKNRFNATLNAKLAKIVLTKGSVTKKELLQIVRDHL